MNFTFILLLSGSKFYLIDEVLAVSTKPERTGFVGLIGQFIYLVLAGITCGNDLRVEDEEQLAIVYCLII